MKRRIVNSVPSSRPGQLWEQTTRYDLGRQVRVLSVPSEDGLVDCVIVANSRRRQNALDRGDRHIRDKRGSITRIRSDRFHPTSGWNLVVEEPDTPAALDLVELGKVADRWISDDWRFDFQTMHDIGVLRAALPAIMRMLREGLDGK